MRETRDNQLNERIKNQVYAGLRLGFGAIVGIVTMILLAYGVEKLRFPEVDDSVFSFLKGYSPRAVGAICLAIALTILASTVNRWAKVLSGLFAYAMLGGLLAILSGGFHSQIPSLQLSRLGAACLTAMFAACALLTMRFSKSNLNWLDRGAAILAPVLLIFAGTSKDADSEFKTITAMVIIFGLSSAYNYKLSRHKLKTTT